MIIHGHVFLVYSSGFAFFIYFCVFHELVCLFFYIFLLFVLKCFYVVSSTWVARISGALGSLGTTRHT